MNDVGEHFSLARILEPLPITAFPALFEVLAAIHVDLAPPFVERHLRQQCGQNVTALQIKNVMEKVKYYFPNALPKPASPGHLPSDLKSMQAYVPESPTTRISSKRRRCAKCEEDTCIMRAPRESCALNMPSSFHGAPEKSEQRFFLLSKDAGLQHASFQEAYCPKCKKFFIGGWMYDKPVGQFGKASQCEWVGAPPGEDVFVIPRQQSMYAVDFKLLTFLTDSLNFSASNSSASVKVLSLIHI